MNFAILRTDETSAVCSIVGERLLFGDETCIQRLDAAGADICRVQRKQWLMDTINIYILFTSSVALIWFFVVHRFSSSVRWCGGMRRRDFRWVGSFAGLFVKRNYYLWLPRWHTIAGDHMRPALGKMNLFCKSETAHHEWLSRKCSRVPIHSFAAHA